MGGRWEGGTPHDLASLLSKMPGHGFDGGIIVNQRRVNGLAEPLLQIACHADGSRRIECKVLEWHCHIDLVRRNGEFPAKIVDKPLLDLSSGGRRAPRSGMIAGHGLILHGKPSTYPVAPPATTSVVKQGQRHWNSREINMSNPY